MDESTMALLRSPRRVGRRDVYSVTMLIAQCLLADLNDDVKIMRQKHWWDELDLCKRLMREHALSLYRVTGDGRRFTSQMADKTHLVPCVPCGKQGRDVEAVCQLAVRTTKASLLILVCDACKEPTLQQYKEGQETWAGTVLDVTETPVGRVDRLLTRLGLQ